MSPPIAIDLSQRQVSALDLASQGLTNSEIAKALGSTRAAVNTCLHRACTKLGANSKAHAVRLGIEAGVLSGANSAALRSELARAYKALAVANGVTRHDKPVPLHEFSEYLLGQMRAA